MGCSYDTTVGPSNVWLLLARGLWKSQVMNLTEVLSTFGQIDHNSQQVVLCFSGNDFWRIDLKQFLYVKHVSRFADSIAD